MSRGPGHVEAQLFEILSKKRRGIFSTAKLCRKVFGIIQVKKKHRVSVLRALKRMSKRSTLDVWRVVDKGSRDDFWFSYNRGGSSLRPHPDSAPAADMRPKKTRRLPAKRYR